MTAQTRGITAGAATATVLLLPLFLLGAAAVSIRRELGITEGDLGVIMAAFLAASLLAAPLGRFGDRVGPALTMRIALVGSAAAVCAIAVFARDLRSLLALELAAGLASALGIPAVNSFLLGAVSPARRGIAFGVKQSAPPLATLVGGLTVPLVVLTVGWRWAFGAAGALALGAVLLVPAGRGGWKKRRLRTVAADGAMPRALWIVAAGVVFGFAATSSLGGFFVDASVSAGLAQVTAGWLLAAGSALAIAARLFGGLTVDRRAHLAFPLVVSMLTAGGCGYLLLALDTTAPMILGAALAFGAGWGWTGLLLFAIVSLVPRSPGATTGTIVAAGALGGVVGPLAFGFLAQAYSYPAAWVAGGSWCVVGALLIWIGAQRMRRGSATSTR